MGFKFVGELEILNKVVKCLVGLFAADYALKTLNELHSEGIDYTMAFCLALLSGASLFANLPSKCFIDGFIFDVFIGLLTSPDSYIVYNNETNNNSNINSKTRTLRNNYYANIIV